MQQDDREEKSAHGTGKAASAAPEKGGEWNRWLDARNIAFCSRCHSLILPGW
jgi:hypothetical protein